MSHINPEAPPQLYDCLVSRFRRIDIAALLRKRANTALQCAEYKATFEADCWREADKEGVKRILPYSLITTKHSTWTALESKMLSKIKSPWSATPPYSQTSNLPRCNSRLFLQGSKPYCKLYLQSMLHWMKQRKKKNWKWCQSFVCYICRTDQYSYWQGDTDGSKCRRIAWVILQCDSVLAL